MIISGIGYQHCQGDGSTITDMRFEGSYKDLNLSQLSKTIAPNRTCREAIEEIAVSIPEVSRNVFNGNAINTKLIYGYPLHSSARRSLTIWLSVITLNGRLIMKLFT